MACGNFNHVCANNFDDKHLKKKCGCGYFSRQIVPLFHSSGDKNILDPGFVFRLQGRRKTWCAGAWILPKESIAVSHQFSLHGH